MRAPRFKGYAHTEQRRPSVDGAGPAAGTIIPVALPERTEGVLEWAWSAPVGGPSVRLWRLR